MAEWKYSINIKRFLTADTVTPEIGRRVVAALKTIPVFVEWDEAYYLDDMLAAADEGDTDGFNNALAEVYDFADQERVWLGL